MRCKGIFGLDMLQFVVDGRDEVHLVNGEGTMRVIRVALLQLSAGATIGENLRSGLAACREARANGADIALLPEVWSHGYAFPNANDRAAAQAWRQTALSVDSEFVRAYRDVAAEGGLAIGLTFLEAHPSGPRNTLALIDGSGELVLRYAKVHTCEFTNERLCAPGEGFSVTTLNTDKGPLEVGAMICYDRENPESARILAIKGAELVLVPNACMFEEHRIAQMKTRAFENMIALAMTNYPRSHPEGNGHSLGIVPMAFSLGGEKNGQGRTQETLILDAGEEAGIYYCDFDLDEIRAYRENAIWGPGARRPAAYAELLTEVSVRDFDPEKMVH